MRGRGDYKMSDGWYIFKEIYKKDSWGYDYEYLGYLGLLNSKERTKRLEEESKKHKHCRILAMKLVKGYEV
jgi:hypothetical protein